MSQRYKRPLAPGIWRIICCCATWACAVALAAREARADDVPPALSEAWNKLPALTEDLARRAGGDWLVTPIKRPAGIYRGRAREIVLDNGLIRRTLRIAPNAATVGVDNLIAGASVIRSVVPEALLSIDGAEYAAGGLTGLTEHAYLLPEWIDSLQRDPAAFRCVDFELGKPRATVAWKRVRHAADVPWPPPGVALAMHYEPPTEKLSGLRVTVHYELYDGMPILCKWISLRNGTARSVNLDRFTSELLAVVEAESVADERDPREWRKPAFHLISDCSFRGMDAGAASHTTEWLSDPQYTSQVNFSLKTPALVVSRPPLGPDVTLAPGEEFTSFRSYLILHDSDSRERQGLAIRRFHRALSPWVTENPLMMHVRSADSPTFRAAVDQCAAVGFEMIIYTFGSGLDMENVDPQYLARIKADVDYAHARGIEAGAYSLLASRRINDDVDVINPASGKTGGAVFGNSPCLCTRWGDDYFQKLRTFIEATGLDLLEHDGSYPGDVCASTRHAGHRGLNDSQWKQWRKIADFYAWCRARGMYLNVPDYYFLAGSNKTGMGYRETNWSLPRERQIILGRQNIFDGTWEKSPSMGWMFVPLVEYQGGGAAATLEPLSQHLDAYEAHLMNNLGAGVQACYRGPRLYDADATRQVVERAVKWFKTYRGILESDMIHLRRPDGRDIDCFLHVNPRLQQRAMVVAYNPLREEAERTIQLPLYYAGLAESARVRERDGAPKTYALDREYQISLPVKVPAGGVAWFVVEAP